ncbi:MAG: RagB/SusD family nutrient uptake outer membrane protein [Muribaculaceae bacterium]|nr:RagB/SusD family nutrient uptake outer membrane protein [Muribaculaceae bacterium]
MKKFIYAIVAICGLLSLSACSEDSLITEPTDSMSGATLMSDGVKALVPLNGIYRSMYTAGWSTTGNTHQCFGISAYNLMAEVMGDDMIMGSSGSGWFWYDAVYDVKDLFTRSSWRSYDLWKAYYTWIANANYILAAEETMGGATDDKNYAIGQAYAIRAYSYFMLAQSFARTYKGHENEPCVPIYTGPTSTTTTGQPRVSVAKVYEQITSDINKACELLQGLPQQQSAHISYGVAQGIRARIALVMEDWATAEQAAEEAIAKCGHNIAAVKDFKGLNDVNAPNVMWGAQIISDQAGGYASLFAHMDTVASYGLGAPKMITLSLYNKISATDTRKDAWWPDPESYDIHSSFNPNNPDYSYNGAPLQRKMYFSDPTQWMGDYIWMRVEEMYLIAAEAECRQGKDGEARTHLMALMKERDPLYTCNKSGNSLSPLTSGNTGSLLEEILLQRRIELWGEAGRMYDIKRLKQGFTREEADGWDSGALLRGRPTTNPENYMWVLTIPQAEFDGNENMNVATDQNPLADE